MTRDLAAEWRDLLASGRARWVRGMVTRRGAVALGKPTRNHLPAAPYHERIATALPDFDDPATLGCLLGLVREAWGPAAQVSPVLTNPVREDGTCPTVVLGWMWYANDEQEHGRHLRPCPTEAAALLSALAAAPVRT